jgi:hypothetical protein
MCFVLKLPLRFHKRKKIISISIFLLTKLSFSGDFSFKVDGKAEKGTLRNRGTEKKVCGQECGLYSFKIRREKNVKYYER